LRCDDPVFREFGQVYMTTAYPGIVKAWHAHRLQDDSFACIHGEIRVGLYDGRENSPTHGATMEVHLSRGNAALVSIPHLVYHGFENIAETEAIVINVVTAPYNADNPDELRIDPFENDIPFRWQGTRGG